MNDDSRAQAGVVLVVVGAVVEGGEQIIGFSEADGEGAIDAEVSSSTEIEGDGGGGVRVCGSPSFYQ